jgi:hypothetical protein
MPTMPENTYIARVHKVLPDTVYREKTNNRFRRGMPDVYYEGDKNCLWVEYKWHPRRPRSLSVSGLLSPLQRKWIHRAAANNRPVAVILGTPDGGILFPDLSWEKPINQPTLLSPTEITKWITSVTMV